MRNLLFLNLWVCFLGGIAAQPTCNLRVYGQVVDHHDGTALGFAVVAIKETSQNVVADGEGNYELTGICAGEYTLVCQHVGCETIERRIKISGDTRQMFFPEHHVEELRQLEVTAKRNDNHTQNSAEISADAIENTRGRTLAEVLAALPGLRTLQSGANVQKPVIQGLHSNRILTLNNNVRQEDQQWGSDHAPNIDPFVADNIEVIKGAAAVAYGSEAMGGAILVHPRPLPLDTVVHGALFMMGRSNGRGGMASAYVEGMNRRDWAWRMQGTWGRWGDLEAPRYVLSNTGFSTQSASLTVGKRTEHVAAELFYSFNRNEAGILRSAHIGNLSDLQAALASGEPTIIRPFTYEIQNPHQASAHHLLKAELTRRLSHIWQYTLRYSAQVNQRQEFDIRRGDRDSIPALHLLLTTQTLDFNYRHKWSAFWELQTGATAMLQNNHNVPGTGIRPLLPDYWRIEGGAFGIFKYHKEKFDGEFGIRYDTRHYRVLYFEQGQLRTDPATYHNLAAMAGLSWQIRPEWSLQTNLGSAYRAPSVIELYSQGLHHSVAAIQEGNKNLKSENALKWTIGTEWQPRRRLRFSLDGFVQYIGNYIFLQPEPEPRLTVRGAFIVFDYTQTNALLAGLDGQVSADISPDIRYEGQVSILRHRDLTRGDYLIYQPSDLIQQRLAWSHQVGLIKVSAHLQHRFTARQSRYPAGFDFMPPPAAYHLWDAGIGVARQLTDGRSLRFDVVGYNLMNTAYRDYLDLLRYYADAPGRNLNLRMWFVF